MKTGHVSNISWLAKTSSHDIFLLINNTFFLWDPCSAWMPFLFGRKEQTTAWLVNVSFHFFNACTVNLLSILFIAWSQTLLKPVCRFFPSPRDETSHPIFFSFNMENRTTTHSLPLCVSPCDFLFSPEYAVPNNAVFFFSLFNKKLILPAAAAGNREIRSLTGPFPKLNYWWCSSLNAQLLWHIFDPSTAMVITVNHCYFKSESRINMQMSYLIFCSV